MIPIFEQGRGRGIGHSHESFQQRFEEICGANPNKNFAFIFYDFQDKNIRRVLKDQAVFTRLDRLSGENLDIFYIHGNRRITSEFNAIFLDKLGIADQRLPCVIFFRWRTKVFTDISAFSLNSEDIVHSFFELYEIVEAYVQEPHEIAGLARIWNFTIGASRFILKEVMKDAIKALFDYKTSSH